MGTAVQGSRLGGTWEAEVGMPREMPKVGIVRQPIRKTSISFLLSSQIYLSFYCCLYEFYLTSTAFILLILLIY